MERFDLLIKNFDSLKNELQIVSGQLKKESSEVFNSIVENSPNFIAIIQDKNYVFVNSCGLRLLHCKSSADIIGKNIDETILTEYRQQVLDRLENLTSSNLPILVKMVAINGANFLLETNLFPFTYNKKPAVLIISRDITEETRQKEQIEEEQKVRTDILNSFKEVIAFYSPKHEIIWLNDAARQQLNIKNNSYIGKKCYKLWFNSKKPCSTCPAVFNKYETSERVVDFPDKSIWKIRHIPLFDNHKELTGFIEFRQNITDEILKEKRQKQVAADALYITQKNTILSEIENVLSKTLSSNKFNNLRNEFSRIFEIIDSYKQLDKDWKMLVANFEEVHSGFFKKLSESFPELTSNDIKHCACIKLNFTTKEIARFFNIKVSSVQISRVRLKKKMHLPNSVDLRKFLSNY